MMVTLLKIKITAILVTIAEDSVVSSAFAFSRNPFSSILKYSLVFSNQLVRETLI